MPEPAPPSSTGLSQPVHRGIEGMRQRPAMYLGSTDLAGLHLLLDEVLLFYLEGALHGALAKLEVTLHADGSCSVRGDGIGLPCPQPRSDGTPGLLAACIWQYDLGLYPEGWGTGRLPYLDFGLLPVNAFSEWFDLAVRHDHTVSSQRFERGQPVERAVPEPPAEVSSYLRWLPDPSIFRVTWSLDAVRSRLETLAFLFPAVAFSLADERSAQAWQFHQPRGLVELVERLNAGRTPAQPPLSLRISGDWGEAALALQYHTCRYFTCHRCGPDCAGTLRAFANGRSAPGEHVRALEQALTGALNDLAHQEALFEAGDPELSWPEVRTRLCVAIAVVVDHRGWEGKYREWLGKASLAQPLTEALREALERSFAADPETWRRIARKAVGEARYRPRRSRQLRLRRRWRPETR